MLTKSEANQLFTALVKAYHYNINGVPYINRADALDLVATFCYDKPKVTPIEKDGKETYKIDWT